ncbi:MAG: GatB/YqeY domain-containing protein, partial [Candidatus Kaiserbacteria bacterium]|nr:GatB/YqeY domain-containing protein [Candidatus Kaiserbacteria bacterium]
KNQRFIDDEDALKVLKRAANQRKDSIEQYEKASRHDLAEPEKAELLIIESYLPTQMSREEIMIAAKAKMAERGYSLKADAGAFIGALMKDFRGVADGSDVKAVVDSLLS